VKFIKAFTTRVRCCVNVLTDQGWPPKPGLLENRNGGSAEIKVGDPKGKGPIHSRSTSPMLEVLGIMKQIETPRGEYRLSSAQKGERRNADDYTK